MRRGNGTMTAQTHAESPVPYGTVREEKIDEETRTGAAADRVVVAGQLCRQQGQRHACPKIKVGDMAPDFTLQDQNGNKVSLHEFRGKKNVALAFYIFAFTGG